MGARGPRIVRIILRGFRGVGPETCLQIDGRHLVLLGDNGCGKSSIVDAVEYALTGDVKPLSKRGQRLSLKRHLANVHTSRAAPHAQVDLSVRGADASMVNGKVTTGRLDERFVEGSSSGNFILRRRQLLSFLEADDRDRYQMLRPFVDLGAFDELEAATKEAARLAAARAQATACEVNGSEIRARIALRLADDAELSHDAILALLNARLVAAGLTETPSLDSVAALRADLERQLTTTTEDSVAATQREAQSALQECVVAAPSNEELDRLVSSCETCLADDAAFGRFSEEVLSQGSQWIQADELDLCPLCEQPIDREKTLQRIEARLGENSERLEGRHVATETTTTIRAAISAFSGAERGAKEKWSKAYSEHPWPLADMASTLDELSQLIPAQGHPTDTIALRKVCKAVRARRPTSQSAALPSPVRPPSSDEDEQIDQSSLVARDTLKWLEDEFPALAKTRSADMKAQRVATRTAHLHSSAEGARKSTMADLFDQIESDIKEVYGAFHPNEGLGGFQIKMKDYAEGSAVLTGDFYSQSGEDPRAYYSEAHQDTLGLAVFLALCRQWSRHWDDFHLVVLDDVLTSIDGPHRARVAKYIVGTLTTTHQVLLTTHDPVLYQRLVETQRSLGKQAEFRNKRIVSYAVDSGPRLGEMQFDYDKLCSDLSGVGHDEILPFAGRLLDDLLNDLRFTLRLSVPAEPDDRYAVGQIWGPFRKKTKRYPRLADACNVLDATTYMRNIGVHSQARALQLSRSETLEFVQGVKGLYEATTCLQCGTVRLSGASEDIACRKGCLSYIKA